MRFLKFLGFLFGSFVKISTRAENIKSDPERAKKSVRFGVLSLILAILALVLILPLSNLFAKIFILGVTNNYYVVGNIFVVLFSLIVACVPPCFALNALSYAITQMYVNRRVISFISLIFSIAVLIFSMLNLLYTLGNFFVGNGVKVLIPLW